MLNRVGTSWKFENETILEDFIWHNLTNFLDLFPVSRQYKTKNGQICDILAKDENNRLFILELKNTEGRYIVQQLTRYYEELLSEKLFTDKIDYRQPVKLVAVAPTFHRDNFTDIKYNKLDLELWQFKIIEQQDGLYFQVLKLKNKSKHSIKILYQEKRNDINISAPSKLLLNILSKCDSEEKTKILEIRNKVLSFDKQIKEIGDGGKILYSTSKNNIFAELRFDSKRNKVALFLWLTNVSARKKKRFKARMRIWTNWTNVTDIAHVPKGLGRTITKEEWKAGEVKPLKKLEPRQSSITKELNKNPLRRKKYEQYLLKIINNHYYDSHYKFGLAMSIDYYINLIEAQENLKLLDKLLDLALNKWLTSR